MLHREPAAPPTAETRPAAGSVFAREAVSARELALRSGPVLAAYGAAARRR